MNRVMNAIRFGSINSVNSGRGLTQSQYKEHSLTVDQLATDYTHERDGGAEVQALVE
jgi:hypothetical protein